VRNLMSGADLAMVNLEGPAPVKSSYHTSGMLFTFNQAYLSGLKNAGIDVVSLANNHVGNAGRQGMRETTAALDNIGIAHAGLGANDTAARAPAMFTVQGVRVAFLAYDSIAPSYWAGPNLEGSAKMAADQTLSDIKAAKAAGAQVVIVYPHWGTEYHTTPTASERTWAHKMIDAGADVIIGNHVHYVAAMEVYKGKPIWYALGNFVFDQNWSEQTEEGLVLELSFNGGTLVQAWMHPILDLANCQPNLLDAASGKVVLNQLYKASAKLPSW
jgi:poly-gamma-glutamate synthesis protein (capsule biosynthesis protein)